MTTVYGIKNCDTVKKTVKWLNDNGIEHQFFDYKKELPSAAQIDGWIAQFGWDVVLNKRGTTYRKLDDATKESLSADNATALLLANPSMIKRPIIETDTGNLIGFKAEQYAEHFNQ